MTTKATPNDAAERLRADTEVELDKAMNGFSDAVLPVFRRALAAERENQWSELVVAGAVTKALSFSEVRAATENLKRRIQDVERRATVEQIRAAAMKKWNGPGHVLHSELWAILDAAGNPEAERV